MSSIDKTKNVQEQYKDDGNLSIRIRLHAKHSTNKQGFIPWLFEKYRFSEDCRILELGCGNGEQWQNRIHQLPEGCMLVLSDLSDGMVKTVWEKYSGYKNFLALQLDIQHLPFPENCFDVVIANHMLYHVPDISKALSEVKRVLKSEGTFYAATNGNGGMRTYLQDAFRQVRPNLETPFGTGFSFNLQNGREILSEYFDTVQRCDYEDSLAITDTQDLIDWLKSAVSISAYREEELDGFYDYFEEIRKKEGAIHIPKETGLFICR